MPNPADKSLRMFRLAVLGAGNWGINHVKTAHRLFGDELALVVDENPQRSAAVAAISPKIKFTSDLSAVLADKSITAVIIATPAATHYDVAKLCLQAGKHVLVEKPMALFSAQGKELEALATITKKTFMVGHLLVYHPAIQKIKELISTGLLGRVQYIYSNRLNFGTVRKMETILWSFAPHDFSVLHYLLGEDPIEIDAKGAAFLQPGIQDVTITTLKFPHNVYAHIHVSWLHPFKEHRLVVIGDKSMVVFEDTREDNKLRLYHKRFDWVNGEPQKHDSEVEILDFGDDKPLDLELLHFKSCVETGATPKTDAINGIKVLEALEVAQARLEDSVQKKTLQSDYYWHPTAIIEASARIGAGSKIWHYSHIDQEAHLGEHCNVGQNVYVGRKVRIGNRVKLQNNVSVYEGVEISDDVFCGPSMVFTNDKNPRSAFPKKNTQGYMKTMVGRGATIGANATVVCGITLGEYCLVGAGSVVTHDVPAYAVVMGNPATFAYWVCCCGTRLAMTDQELNCPTCHSVYKKKGNILAIS